MGEITTAAAQVWRDSEVFGLPASGNHKPIKSEIRTVLSSIDAGIDLVAAAVELGAVVVVATQSALYADLAHAANTLGIVWQDATPANNAVYVKTGASGAGGWSLTNLTVPGALSAYWENALAEAQAAAVQTAADRAVVASDMAVATTAAATATAAEIQAVAAESAAVAAAEASGISAFFDTKAAAIAALAGLADLAVVMVFADESRSGDQTIYRKQSGALALKIDQSTSVVSVPLFSDIASKHIPINVTSLRTAGRNTAGDAGGALYYRKLTVEANAPGDALDADSARWGLVRTQPIFVTMFGAKGDGGTIDTAAFLAARDFGCSYIVPDTGAAHLLDAPVNHTANGQWVTVKGAIDQTGANANADALVWTGGQGGGVRFLDNGVVTPGTTVSSIFQGWAIKFQNRTNVWAIDPHVTGHRRVGVGVLSCTSSGWVRGYVHDSVVNPAVDNYTNAGYDYGLFNGCVDCTGWGGLSKNGAGVTHALQTLDTNSGSGYTVSGNRLFKPVGRNAGQYGVLAYKLNDNDVWINNLCDGLDIDGVSGAIRHPTYGGVFGAAAYQQGLTDKEMRWTNGKIRRACLQTDTLLLAPGGFGAANTNSVDVSGFDIDQCAWYSAFLANPNGVGPAGVARISASTLRGAGKANLATQDWPELEVEGGEISGAGEQNVLVHNVGTTSTVRSAFRGVRNTDGAEAAYDIQAGDTRIEGGLIARNGRGIAHSSPGDLRFGELDFAAQTGYDLDVQTGAGDAISLGGSKIDATSNRVAVRAYRPIRWHESDNIAGAGNSTFAGQTTNGAIGDPTTFGWTTGLPDPAVNATPSVKNGRVFRTTATGRFSGFADGRLDQVIVIRVDHNTTFGFGGDIIPDGYADLAVVAGSIVSFWFDGGNWRQFTPVLGRH